MNFVDFQSWCDSERGKCYDDLMASIRGPALNIATTNLIFLISLSGRYCDPGVTQCLYSSIILRARGRGNEKIIIIRGVVCLKSLGHGSNTSRCWTEIMWHAWSISFHFPAYDLLILRFFLRVKEQNNILLSVIEPPYPGWQDVIWCLTFHFQWIFIRH